MPQQLTALAPLTFQPIFKDYPWGGRNLATKLGRALPDGTVAESWEIAAHPHGSTQVDAGSMAGMSLPQVMEVLGLDLVGRRSAQVLEFGRFPLLVKLLDANSWLSVQVHPDNGFAQEYEGDLGKTEMWVVLHAEPGAQIVFGFRPGVTRDSYSAAVAQGRAADDLQRLAVQQGDVVFVPAGTVHALGPGIIVAEIQQNSDTTYRIFDWGRPRETHVERALQVLDFEQVDPTVVVPTVVRRDDDLHHEVLASCPCFQTERIVLRPGQVYSGECDGETFELWGVLDGAATLTSVDGDQQMAAVSWTLLPAALGAFSVTCDAQTTLLRVFVPEEVLD